MRPLLFVLASAALAAPQVNAISGPRIRADLKFLSSDLLEGRGVGTRGGQFATEYIATQFALAGLKPAGDNGTYFQRVPMVGVETSAASRFEATAAAGSAGFQLLRDFVAANPRQTEAVDFDAEAVFVGHGIVAPEFGWDDFKDADVRGKILVLFTNEPPSDDPKFFGGPALTYYGRWTYKYEQALRKGALGAIIIHTDQTAGYGWNVVRNSWGREQSFLKLAPGAPALALAGWITQEAGNRMLALAGRSLAELLAAADRRDFRPLPLGLRLRGSLRSKIRDEDTRNVVAMAPGSDPALASQAVMFSAHWDHLGIGPAVNGDAVYNGAVDNASGCAMLLELARAWSALEQKPRRPAIFVSFTAEESGLLGSEYYSQHPAVPAAGTAADFNLDGLYPFGRSRDVVLTGAERASFWPLVQETAQRFELAIDPDPEPGQGHFYRSDHFPLARVGIPAFSISQGNEYAGKPVGWGEQAERDYRQNRYHQPSDEYRDDWDVSGYEQLARFTMALGLATANLEQLPARLSKTE
jgi:Zn-dependent M28 family amino/carboxypeptidase